MMHKTYDPHFHNCVDGIHGQHIWKCFRPDCKETVNYECGLSVDSKKLQSTRPGVESNKPKGQRSIV